MGIIDAYGHVSLPRQMSGDAFVRIMDENDVEFAMICTAETCPDVGELHRSAVKHRDRVRVAGLPTGTTAQERRESIRAQMRCGFVGARLQAGMIAREAQLLEEIGAAGGIAIVVGGQAYRACAPELLQFLNRYPRSYVWGAHFGEPSSLEDAEDPGVKALFGHDRFSVICSRHSAQSASLLQPWAKLLIERLSWDRLLFGSEYPVALWRNELYAETTMWMDRFSPTPQQREGYLRGNAWRMLFSLPAPKVHALDPRWIDFVPDVRATVELFPNNTLKLPGHVHQALVQRYLSEPQAVRGRYGEFLARILKQVADSSSELSR